MRQDAPYKPPERHQTIRQQMFELLWLQPMTIRDLSQYIGICEKEAAGHLDHLARSSGGRDGKLKVTPSRCLDCDFTFTARKRLTKPGRCPQCKGTHISPPLYHIV